MSMSLRLNLSNAKQNVTEFGKFEFEFEPLFGLAFFENIFQKLYCSCVYEKILLYIFLDYF